MPAATNGNGTSNGHMPLAKSSQLILAQPTIEEMRITWEKNAVMWGGALDLPQYLQREEHLTNASPLTRDGGVSHWVLVDKDQAPNERQILASAESLKKRTYVRYAGSNEIREGICHGIGSVFCYPEHRGHGYASRMMTELGQKLKTHQGTKDCPVMFSALWSDIGKEFYAKHGWKPFASTHVEFPAKKIEHKDDRLKMLYAGDIPKLCKDDEAMIKASMLKSTDGKTHMSVAPDISHFEWHRAREVFLTKAIFGKTPDVRGAMIGQPGARMWALWTRAYYGKLDAVEQSGNTLHILRLVIEDEEQPQTDERLARQAEGLKAILEAAQDEAQKWRLRHVEMWNPSELAKGLIEKVGIDHTPVERQVSSIPSLMWYGPGQTEEVQWIKNEKFTWC